MASPKPTRLASLLNKVHPQLPLSPRESQQLATALSRSFREQLDKEHPQISATSRGHSDAHISSILASPHFDGSRRRPSSQRARSRSPSSIPKSGTLEQLQSFLLAKESKKRRSPDSFRAQVVVGDATIETAKDFLQHFHEADLQARWEPASSTTGGDVMVEQRPGRVIANWLWSTGLEESLVFLHDARFVKLVVARLCAEGNTQRVQSWLEKAGRKLREDGSEQNTSADLLEGCKTMFGSLVVSTRKYQGINEALRNFDEVAKKLQSEDLVRQIGPIALRRLFHALTSSDRTQRAVPTDIDVGLYDDFAQSLPKYLRGTHLNYRLAWLSLKHPQNPDASKAMAFLKRVRVSSAMSGAQKAASMRDFLEVADFVLSQDRYNEAREILETMAATFPAEMTATADSDHVVQRLLEEMQALSGPGEGQTAFG